MSKVCTEPTEVTFSILTTIERAFRRALGNLDLNDEQLDNCYDYYYCFLNLKDLDDRASLTEIKRILKNGWWFVHDMLYEIGGEELVNEVDESFDEEVISYIENEWHPPHTK